MAPHRWETNKVKGPPSPRRRQVPYNNSCRQKSGLPTAKIDDGTGVTCALGNQGWVGAAEIGAPRLCPRLALALAFAPYLCPLPLPLPLLAFTLALELLDFETKMPLPLLASWNSSGPYLYH
jgi:hypothetical protein